MTEQLSLLPCPFCGEELYRCRYNDGKARYAHPANGCIIQREFIYTRSVERWNTRANLAPTVKPLEWQEFPSAEMAHNGLGWTYRITWHNDPEVGFLLYRHESSGKTGLGAHEDPDELKKIADYDNSKAILSALTTAPVTPQQAAEVLHQAFTSEVNEFDFKPAWGAWRRSQWQKDESIYAAMSAFLKAIAEDKE